MSLNSLNSSLPNNTLLKISENHAKKRYQQYLKKKNSILIITSLALLSISFITLLSSTYLFSINLQLTSYIPILFPTTLLTFIMKNPYLLKIAIITSPSIFSLSLVSLIITSFILFFPKKKFEKVKEYYTLASNQLLKNKKKSNEKWNSMINYYKKNNIEKAYNSLYENFFKSPPKDKKFMNAYEFKNEASNIIFKEKTSSKKDNKIYKMLLKIHTYKCFKESEKTKKYLNLKKYSISLWREVSPNSSIKQGFDKMKKKYPFLSLVKVLHIFKSMKEAGKKEKELLEKNYTDNPLFTLGFNIYEKENENNCFCSILYSPEKKSPSPKKKGGFFKNIRKIAFEILRKKQNQKK